ncbi:HNH endonuclease [Brevundimonas sp. BAL450]|uniref:HNH endonuclease n=1 Tax=Brevundimonas sp. BAL450 TaxID=1708162 RepID=UPI0018CB6519|nr:hypothetical protein [Brevundimonas sp. BAL450]MBG7615611.1 HNH endonuclease [Brevundimonas sp. BAL450]
MASIQAALGRLEHAIAAGHHQTRCLRRWSEFIRERDDHRCVDCHSTENLSAHHICRKTFLPEAALETGNGITLCRDCHREVHRGFNGRPDMQEPMDAQGGEKLPAMERLYCILDQDAVERNTLDPALYQLSDTVLGRFKRLQGFASNTDFPGPPVRQAYLIWAQASPGVREAVARANGLTLPKEPLLPGDIYVERIDEEGERTGGTILQNPRWR